MRSIATVVVFALASMSAEAASAPCLEYEPQVVEMRGALSVETFPGPPNFSDLAKGDKPERVWILTLSQPICVSANTSDELYRAVPKATRVQVGFADFDGYKRYESMLGHDVVVSGSLFPAHTGHHHTDILMTIRTIKRTGRT
jgi:hypothetical protein